MKLDLQELERVVKQGIAEGKSGQQVQSAGVGTSFAEDKPIATASAVSATEVSGKKKFRITVEGVDGTCVACHRSGEVFYVEEDKTPQGICLTAFSGLLPYINAMICDASFPWESAPGRIRLGCPDPDNNVVFVIEEIK